MSAVWPAKTLPRLAAVLALVASVGSLFWAPRADGAGANGPGLTLQVPISTLRSARGDVFVAVYERGAWLIPGRFKTYRVARASTGTVQVTIPNLPPGQYALAVFHDENDNGRVDTNWAGLPTEGFGFSRVSPLRVPSFDETSFDTRHERTVPVTIRY